MGQRIDPTDANPIIGFDVGALEMEKDYRLVKLGSSNESPDIAAKQRIWDSWNVNVRSANETWANFQLADRIRKLESYATVSFANGDT